ncbi:CvpA family protein [Pontibacterium sp.]|uniref:CvpA family protein n=1 Tax=Pontibacterium sp. TaxID=2036026 RepID=UPI0035628B26
MNWADWVILAIIAISCLFSVRRGFIREALSLVTWVAAFMVARTFSGPMIELLQPYIETPSIRVAAAFASLFIVTLIVGALIGQLFTMLIQATGLSATDRLLGIAFGAARGGLVVVVLVMLAGQTPAVDDPWWRESQLIPHFALMEAWTKEVAGDVADLIWNAGR